MTAHTFTARAWSDANLGGSMCSIALENLTYREKEGKKNSQRSSEEVFEQNFRSVRAPGLGLWPFFFYPTGLQRPWHMSGGAVCPLSGYRHEPVALQEHSHRTLPCLGSHAQPCRCQKSQVFPRGSGFSKPHWYFPSFCIDSAWHSLGC